MGTRAQFFVGDPRDVEGREYLGCVAWDGYPCGDCGDALEGITDEQSFRVGVAKIAADRSDFSDPAERSFPFPWKDDLFLTDCTYAWFGGAVQFTWFHRGFVDLDQHRMSEEFREEYGNRNDELPGNVPAPTSDKPRGHDSIMVVSVRP